MEKLLKYIVALAHCGGLLPRGNDRDYILALITKLSRQAFQTMAANLSHDDWVELVLEAEIAAQQSVQPTVATEPLEDSPWQTGIRRGAVISSNRNSG